jgi:hypothetical protein
MRKIVNVQEVLPVREFTGRNGPGKEYSFKDSEGTKYETFDDKIYSLLQTKDGSEIDLEWDDTISKNGQFTNHRIKMIYVDGKPAIAPKESKPFSGGFKGRSAETDISIERQCCLKCACEMCHEGSAANIVTTYAELLFEWLHQIKPITAGDKDVGRSTPIPATPPASPQAKSEPSKPQQPINVIPKVNAMTLEALNQLAKDKDTFDKIKLEVKTKGWTTGKDKFTLKDLTQPQADIILRQFSEPAPDEFDKPF